MQIKLFKILAGLTPFLLIGCESLHEPTKQSFQPKFDLPAGTRVTIIPENGDDCLELSHKLYELFASRGYYRLIDRANLGQTFEERKFQNMSFVEKRPVGDICGVDAFLYLQAQCVSGQSQATDPLTILLVPNSVENNANYVAIYRMVLVSNGQIIAARQIRLSDREGIAMFGGMTQHLVQKLREKAAFQIFESLHP